MQETEIDPVNVIYKIQKLMNELMESNGQVILGGGVDNMEKYNYILGKIHVLDQIKQEKKTDTLKKQENF